MPDYWHGKGKDHEVNEHVRRPVPTEELVLVDTSPARNRLVPEVRDWLALKYGDKDVHDEIEYDDDPCKCQFPSEPTSHAEKAVV